MKEKRLLKDKNSKIGQLYFHFNLRGFLRNNWGEKMKFCIKVIFKTSIRVEIGF